MRQKFIRLLVGVYASLLAMVLFAPPLFATTVSQGYTSNQSESVGTVVSLSSSGENQVEDTTSKNESRLLGVVASGNNALIDIQPKGSNISVAVNGQTEVLVTDINGAIKSGDLLIISPLNGLAMKDSNSSDATKFIGVAKEDFNGSTSDAHEVTVSQSDNSKKTVKIGKIKVDLLISDRQASKSVKNHNILSSVGEFIVGRPVNSLRLLVAAAALISSLAVSGILLVTSIRSTFVSIGRNPLARSSIITSLMKVIIVSLMIFIAGLVSAYLVIVL